MLFLKPVSRLVPLTSLVGKYSRGLFSVCLHTECLTGLQVIHGLLLDDKNLLLVSFLR